MLKYFIANKLNDKFMECINKNEIDLAFEDKSLVFSSIICGNIEIYQYLASIDIRIDTELAVIWHHVITNPKY